MVNIKLFKVPILSFILIVFHLVGLYFISQPQSFEYFASLSGWNLYLTFLLFLLSFSKIEVKLIYFFILCFVVGMSFEWLGVHTGIVFGDYKYGNNLGVKLFDVPIAIGINWIILTVSSANIAHLLFNNSLLKAFTGTSIMVGLDFLIEQIAPKLDFWYWENNTIPTYNYITWFGVGFFLQLVYFRYKLVETNIFTLVLFITLVVFFMVLNFTI